jgi:hypothetical protein
VDLDPELGWPCPWVKIMQLLGVDHCYLVTGHEGDHLFKGYIPRAPPKETTAQSGGFRLPARPAEL